ncbi:MAG: porphobilinogen synthase, partial [Acidimicrobiaceae bacterium]
ARAALAQASAGADVVAPSGMMDGQVLAIRDALDEDGHETVAILAYAAKYVSTKSAPARFTAVSCSRATAAPSIQPRSAAAITIAYSPDT